MMEIQYLYRNKTFTDIRDIVENNSLWPDFDVILNEYIPFQVFISGRTLYKGVTIKPTVTFKPSDQQESDTRDFKSFFSSSINRYLSKYCYLDSKNPIAAVSGGIDSSVLALELEPKTIYSGYYVGKEYDETKLSGLIAKLIDATHIKISLTEDDFLNNMDECRDAICTPAGGFGSVMEYVALKRVLKTIKTDSVLFGHGGDEIFLGYFFNHFIRLFYRDGMRVPEYMPNFAPSKRNMAESMADSMIVMAMGRYDKGIFCLPFAKDVVYPALSDIPDIIDKLLFANINWTLPSLLHLNGQMCRALGVRACNPLANADFIGFARSLNSEHHEMTKHILRNVRPDLPKEISLGREKKGFPAPVRQWKRLDRIMRGACEAFFRRMSIGEVYPGINRRTWGIFEAEMFLRRMGK